MEYREILLDEIFADEEFNSRGHIRAMDCSDLARDIDENGLTNPVTVCPISEEMQAEYLRKKTTGYNPNKHKYLLVAGYRRRLAFMILNRTTLPAMLREHVTQQQASIINLSENIKRADLNIVQEANAIERIARYGYVAREIAQKLNVSPQWVTTRQQLLKLPIEIQKEAIAGTITQHHINKIAKLQTKDEQFAAVRAIKDAKSKGKDAPEIGPKKKNQLTRTAARNKSEIQELINFLLRTKGLGESLTTIALAWACGNMSNLDLLTTIKNELAIKGIPFDIPEDGIIPNYDKVEIPYEMD